METYIATIAVGPPGTDGNTYEAAFEADDFSHAYEQAADHVRSCEGSERVVCIDAPPPMSRAIRDEAGQTFLELALILAVAAVIFVVILVAVKT